MNDQDRFLDLSSRFIEGTLNEHEEAELSRRLEHDAEARRTLARLIHQHGNLHWLLGKTRPEADLPPRTAPRSSVLRARSRRQAPASPSSPILWLSAAAVFVVVLLGAILSSGGPAPKPPAPLAREATPVPKSIPAPRSADRPTPPAPPSERPPIPGARPRSERRVDAPLPPPPPSVRPMEPAKPRPSPSPPRKTEVAPAKVLALLEDSGEKREIREGQEVRTGEQESTLTYRDGTRIVLSPGSVLARISEKERNAGKYLSVSSGTLSATVPKQPSGRPLVISTPRALVRVVGTEFTLEVAPESTRLEVTEGKVRLARPSGITSVLVAAGYYAIAAPGIPLEARPIPVPIARISFGPTNAPVPEGYRGDDGAPFDPQRRYGWDIDRSTGTRLRAGTQSLHDRRSIIAGSADEEARWEYAVPNGTYRVTVICGGELTSQGPHRVRVEGTLLFGDVFSRKGEHPSRTATVRVGDGRLTITSGALGTSLRAADGTHDTILNSVTLTRIR